MEREYSTRGYALKTALISSDGLYRYSLLRAWGDCEPCLLWVMLNPSTADADKDDPTIRRVVGFTERFGFQAALILNLFAFRTTWPEQLRNEADKEGPEGDKLFEYHAGKQWVAAWGAQGAFYRQRVREVCRIMGPDVWCVGETATRQPKHPLYVHGETNLRKWEGIHETIREVPGAPSGA